MSKEKEITNLFGTYTNNNCETFKIPNEGYRIYLCNDGNVVWFKDTLNDYKSNYFNLFYCFNANHKYDLSETLLFKEEELYLENVNKNNKIFKDFIEKDTVNNIKLINEHTFVSIFDCKGNNIFTKAIYPLCICDFNNKY
jgi:hypothetical protein